MSQFGRRLSLVGAGLALGFVAIVARAVQLQASRHAAMRLLAEKEYLNELRLPPVRGRIYDRYGKSLAASVEVPSVHADPMAISDPRPVANQLAKILDADAHGFYRRLREERRFVWLKRHITPEQAGRIQALNLAGVGIVHEPRRYYPNRELAGHVLGFAGLDAHGLEGVEKQLDTTLYGTPQVVEAVRDGRGQVVLPGGVAGEARAGGDVYLTLDIGLQHLAEAALRRAVDASDAQGGVAIVLDVASAEVLGLAVEPHFNPNDGAQAPSTHRRNRALVDVFEPASTFKPIVIAAALDAGVLRADERINCENGSYRIGRHTIRDAHPYATEDVTRILQRSINIGSVKIAEKLGRRRLADALARFGLGDRTGLGFPGEAAGIVHDAAHWSDVGLANIGFGHGVAVTAMQLAAAYRVLAAGGRYRAPALVQRIEPGEPLVEREERQVIAPKVARAVTQMLESVVHPDGTGYFAAVEGYAVAGKTGTAQKVDTVGGGYSQDKHVALFAGYLPADAPQVVIVVAIDEPQGLHTGGAIAAPVFAEIAAGTMQQLGIPARKTAVRSALVRARTAGRDELEEAARVEVAEEVAVADGALPSFVGLTARQAVQRYRTLGAPLTLELVGSGQVVEQEPVAGSRPETARKLRLVLAWPAQG